MPQSIIKTHYLSRLGHLCMAGFFARWKHRILKSRMVQWPLRKSKNWVLPGFNGLTIYQVVKFSIVGIQKGRLTNRAAAVSYRFLLAVPPLLIVLLSIIPFIPIQDFQTNLFLYIAKAMPANAFELVEQTLDDLINKKQQTLISISFFLALFYASNAIQAILDGFNHSYHIQKTHSMVVQYARSFLLMIIFSVVMILGVALITLSGPILSYLRDLRIIGSDAIVFFIEVIKWLIVVMLFEIGISVLYRAGLSGKWRALNAGASFATLGLIIVSSLFAWYVNNFGNYNKLYGSVGTVLVVMLWIYFNCIVLLIGFEINAAIAKASDPEVANINPEDAIR